MISKGRVVCSRFFLQLIGFLSVSYQNTKGPKNANLLKLLVERGGKIVVARSYNHVRILMKFIFFVDLTNATKGPNRQRIKGGKGRQPDRAIQLKRSPQ